MGNGIVAGTVLGHYKVLRLLGEGGMGAVYEAEDQKLGRRVALKLLPRELTEHSERRARFEREARSVAALQHPNIVTLHAIEEVDGRLFLVMELVEGTPLNKSIPATGMELESFLDLAIPLTDAVAAAHAHGITHRDLKPANVVVDRDGEPRVLDFGLAKSGAAADSGGSIAPTQSLRKDETLTGEGKILGTVAYMSPEQAEGKPVDHRSDIFSLGAMLYEMATGRRPFSGETGMSVISSILRDDPESVTEVRHSFPNHAGRIIRRCLQKDPKRRYQTALDLKNDLVELREDLDSGLLDAPVATPAPPRSRWTWAAMLSLAVLAVATVVWVVRSTGSESSEPPSKRVRRLITQGTPVGAAAISPDGRYLAYMSWGDGRETIRLLQVATGSDVDLTDNQDPQTRYGSLHFSADGDYLFYTTSISGSTSTLWRLPTLGGQPDKLLDSILEEGVVSPDGAWVVAIRGDEPSDTWNTLEVVALEDGSVRSRTALEGQEIWGLVWGADGESLFAASADIGDEFGGVGLYRLAPDGGDLGVLVPPGEFTEVDYICREAGGEALIVNGLRSSSGGRLHLWRVELDTGAIDLIYGDYSDYHSCSVTADGSALVTLREDVRSRLWTLAADGSSTPSVVTTTSGVRDGARGVAWLDNETLVYGALGGGMPQIWRTSVAAGSSRRLTTQGGVSPRVGRGHILYGGGWSEPGGWGIFALPAAGGSPRRLSPEGVPSYTTASLSADGEWVFYQELVEDGMRLIRRPWQEADGGDPIVMYDGSAHLVRYSPDGSRFTIHELGEDGVWRTAIYPADFGPREKLLDVHSELTSPWASNESIYIVRTEDGVRNIYEVWAETLQERQVTHFTEDNIFAFDVSPDLTTLAVARGEITNELLLIENP